MGVVIMLDWISIYLNYERGKASGHGGFRFIIAFVLFLILFKPIVWLMKVTGIFSLLQWTGLIDTQGSFSFEMAFVYIMLFFVLGLVLAMVGYIWSTITTFLIAHGNKR